MRVEARSQGKSVIGVLLAGLFASGPVAIRPDNAIAQGASPAAQAAHSTIGSYLGPETCVSCHAAQAADLLGSSHYQWTGPTPNVPNIDGSAGKAMLGFNTYCGTPLSSPRPVCWSCHAGNGGVPTTNAEPQQYNNMDCMMCHQDAYKRVPAGPFETVTFPDYQGVEHSWQQPITDAQGNYLYRPDEQKMTMPVLQAAQTVHPPTRASCLRCHAGAAGSDGAKRGDLSSVSANPPLTSDIHLSPQGGNLACQSCHEFSHHKVLGRGLDLRENDRPERLDCTRCHPAQPHAIATMNRHTARVACQTCHIPTYGKDMPTETHRDWLHPYWSPTACSGQGGYKPEEVKAGNLIPSYKWFDGTSEVYALGQAPWLNSRGEYALAEPLGSVSAPGAKIYPMKEHGSNSAIHAATGQLIPHSTFAYFTSGDFNRAVAVGLEYAGLSGNWSVVNIHAYQTINHGVEPSANALSCGACHTAFSGGAPVRMNLQTDLGYGLKGSHSQVCGQCHSTRPSPGFASMHHEHVDDMGYDCSRCHSFSRPERNLMLPAAGTLQVTAPSLSHTIIRGQSIASQTISVDDSLNNGFGYTVGDNAWWLRVEPGTGGVWTETDTLTVEYQTAALQPGSYTAQVDFTAPGATNSPVTITASVVVLSKSDFNSDGQVNDVDLEVFAACRTGPALTYTGALPPGCSQVPDTNGIIPADFDADGDVDQTDFGFFQRGE